MFSGRKSKRKAKLLKNISQDVDPSLTWKITGDLGEGSFGMVHKVENSSTKELAAAKIIPVQHDDDLEDFVVEVDILMELKHPGIIGLCGAWLWSNKLWVVLELCEGGAIDDILEEIESGLSENFIKCIANQMLSGLKHLHENNVIHRDLKAGNVLLKADGSIKITDFGVSALLKKSGQKRDTFIGTPYWMAPEVVLCENSKDKPYDSLADVWSFGITLIELAERSPPWHDMHPMRVLFKIPKSSAPTLNDTEKWSDDFHDILRRCLQKSPQDRETCAQMQDHAFVRGHDGRAPLRDLYRLVSADVTEVLEDITEAELPNVASSGMSVSSVGGAGAAAPTGNSGSGGDAPTKPLPGIRSGGSKRAPPSAPVGEAPAPTTAQSLAAELAAIEHINGAIADAQRESKEGDSVSKAISDPQQQKHYKTLTKTRQYVNEEGEIITVSTQRVVETSQQSGKLMTIRRGMVNIDSDWKDAEAKRMALLRKAQLRETKRMQRDEQKECAEVVAKLKVEREQCDARHRKELDGFEQDASRQVSTLQRQAAAEKTRLEKSLALRRKKELERISSENANEERAFKASKSKETKTLVKTLGQEVPKAERKQSIRRGLEEAKETMSRDHQELLERLALRATQQTQKLDEQLKEQQMSKETKLLEEEQNLIRELDDKRSQLLVRHMQEKQQILHHQLKATFWMQKHQMHFRHEKEAEQLKQLQERKLINLENKYTVEQKLLPRKQKSAHSTRKKELKKSLPRAERKERLSDFVTRESTRMRAENEVMNSTYKDTMAAMKDAMAEETGELQQMQATRKQLLVQNENSKVTELESAHAAELQALQLELQGKRQELDGQLRAQYETLLQFYSSGGFERAASISA
eukprot:m.647185 g.647185  ORF g.647185 m.647185 type:complete len:868 (+) comp22655_c0_seq1:158-2761(+)